MPDMIISQQRQSHVFRNIIIIIIIAVLIWQYLLPSFMDIKTPSEYISDFLAPASLEEVYFNAFIIDHYTGAKISFPKTMPEYFEYNMTLDHVYSIGMEANLPGSLLNDYHWNTNILVLNETLPVSWESYPTPTIIKGYTCYYTHSWTLPGYLLANRTYSFQMTMYSDSGDPIKAKPILPGGITFNMSISVFKA